MEKEISLEKVYEDLQNLKEILKRKKIIESQSFFGSDEIIWDWQSQTPVLADENLLSEDWLSPEDEEAWKGL